MQLPSNWQRKIGSLEEGFLHHAFLIEGDSDYTRTALRNFFEEQFSILTASNPDFCEQEFISFGIDDGRSLKEMQSRRAFTDGGKKMFVIISNTFTTEAQNSLLKIFEEPTPDTLFFILVPSAKFFLPTLLSRVVIISAKNNKEENFGEVADFLNQSYSERLAFIQKIAKDEKDVNRSERLIQNLISFFEQKNKPEKRTKEEIRTLELALNYWKYAHRKAPSFKMMLEHLALVAPR